MRPPILLPIQIKVDDEKNIWTEAAEEKIGREKCLLDVLHLDREELQHQA